MVEALWSHCEGRMKDLMSKAERADYPASLYRTMLDLAATGKVRPGLAKAISETLESFNDDLRCDDHSLLVPLDALVATRALATTPGSAGGYLVGADVAPAIETVLRAASVCARAGARTLPNLI